MQAQSEDLIKGIVCGYLTGVSQLGTTKESFAEIATCSSCSTQRYHSGRSRAHRFSFKMRWLSRTPIATIRYPSEDLFKFRNTVLKLQGSRNSRCAGRWPALEAGRPLIGAIEAELYRVSKVQKAPTIEQAIAHGYTLLQMGRKTDALACFSVAAAQPQISSPDQHLAVRLGEWILGRTENTPLEALESWECSDSVAFTSALLYVWRLTTIRLRMETMKGYDFKLKDASLNEALELQRRFRKCCSTFVTLLPHEDRELGLILCLAGRPKAAARHLKLSLEAAKLSDLILERALTTRELSRVRKFLGKDFPRFNCQSAVKTLERLGYNLPKGEGHQAPRRNKTPETLQQEFLDLAGQVVRSRSDSSLLRAVDSFCHTLLPELQTARVATENSGSDETVFRLCGRIV